MLQKYDILHNANIRHLSSEYKLTLLNVSVTETVSEQAAATGTWLERKHQMKSWKVDVVERVREFFRVNFVCVTNVN